MMMNPRKIIFAFTVSLLAFTFALAQPKTIDKIVAVVGNNIVTQAQLESQYLQYANRTNVKNLSKHEIFCRLLEQSLFQKLLVAQAQKDSLEVSDAQVDGELDRRVRYFINQFGSEQKFQEFYGKSVDEFKNDLRDDVKDILLAQRMQGKITDGITVTPADVRAYYNNIPKDSLPYVNEELEIAQLIKKPSVSLEAKREAKEKVQTLRNRIVDKKEDFAALAALYSEDPGSAAKGGQYDSLRRGVFVPEFEEYAFSQAVNEVSPVFETTYGYHILQVTAKRGELIDVRHILITAKSTPADLQRASVLIDSIYTLIKNDSISFREAASRFSDDEEVRVNGGLITNPANGSTRFEKEDLGQYDPTLAFTFDKMKVGDITKPSLTVTRDGKQAYKILYLKSRTEPHTANLKEDYQKIQTAAQNEKQNKAVQGWIKKNLNGTYVRIEEEYLDCNFDVNWTKK
jgi:peptidyl-prolyl cis-trans isomerase SurA